MNKKHQFYLLSLGLILLTSSIAYGQALHWLSQPQSQLGPIHNNSMDGDVEMSANGRFVAFVSSATNIVSGELGEASFRNLYVYDRLNDTTTIVNQLANGQQFFIFSSSFSAPTSDGQLIAFMYSGDLGFGNINNGLYIKNLDTNTFQLISQDSNNQAFSIVSNTSVVLADDGNSINFITTENLVPEHQNFNSNVYRKNLINDTFSLLSMSADNTEAANDSIRDFFISPNGRYAVFESSGSNLSDDLIIGENLFLRDTQTQTTQVVTIQPSGLPSSETENISSRDFSVSNTGTVAFASNRTDLVVNDNNQRKDLFLYDGSIERLNVDDNGQELSDTFVSEVYINAVGNRILFADFAALSDNDNDQGRDLYLYNFEDGSFEVINQALEVVESGFLTPLSISSTGEHMIYYARTSQVNDIASLSSVLDQGLFYYNALSDETQQIEPVAFNPETVVRGVLGIKLSNDQRYGIYSSRSPNLLPELETDFESDIIFFDRQSNTRTKLGNNTSSDADISANGRYIVYRSNFFQPEGIIDLGETTLFLFDRQDNSTTLIGEGFFAKVNNGGMVAFQTERSIDPADDNGDADIYLFNPSDNSINLISKSISGVVGNMDSNLPSISDSESAVSIAFTSNADNLVFGDINSRSDAFVVDWPSGIVTRVSQTAAAVGGNASSFYVSLSAGAEYVAFGSLSDNLTNDTYNSNNNLRPFVYDRSTQTVELITKDDQNMAMDIDLFSLDISTSGRYVIFETQDSIDPTLDSDQATDVILADRDTNELSVISQQLNGTEVFGSFRRSQVYEDINVSPSLIGVSFGGDGALTSIVHKHPGHDEAYLYQQGGPNVDLSIEVIGNGSVTGTQGITCMTTCDSNYPLGTQLTLVATADVDFIFDGWLSSFGQCTDDSNPCVLTMDQAKSIQAIFIDPDEIIFANGFE